MDHLRWRIGDGQVAMSLAADGDLRQAAQRTAWCGSHAIPPPTVTRQVHGTRVIGPGVPSSETLEADALVAVAGNAVGVFGADCPSLVVVAPDAIAVAHCGWRGTTAGIVASTIAALRHVSRHPPETWHALVGPGVHPDDYEVDEAVISARVWPTGCLAPGRPGHAWLDLPAAVAADCHAAGVASAARTGMTTSRDARLHSHRRDGAGAPQLLIAWRPACAG